MIREFDLNKSEWVEKLNPNSVLATDIWMNKVDWRGCKTKDKPSIGTHLREVNRQVTVSARPGEAYDGDYSPANESKSAHNIPLETYRGTVVYYFDHL